MGAVGLSPVGEMLIETAAHTLWPVPPAPSKPCAVNVVATLSATGSEEHVPAAEGSAMSSVCSGLPAAVKTTLPVPAG